MHQAMQQFGETSARVNIAVPAQAVLPSSAYSLFVKKT
jgi:hypothetical protein